jgi:hypothetical protein
MGKLSAFLSNNGSVPRKTRGLEETCKSNPVRSSRRFIHPAALPLSSFLLLPPFRRSTVQTLVYPRSPSIYPPTRLG